MVIEKKDSVANATMRPHKCKEIFCSYCGATHGPEESFKDILDIC